MITKRMHVQAEKNNKNLNAAPTGYLKSLAENDTLP